MEAGIAPVSVGDLFEGLTSVLKPLTEAKQVLDEVKWLLHYTADFPRLEKRLARIQAQLGQHGRSVLRLHTDLVQESTPAKSWPVRLDREE